MRIGILTFHWATNYGAILQCCALQNYLEELGHQVEVIDYKPDLYDWNLRLIIRHPSYLFNLRQFFQAKRKEAKLIPFRRYNLKLSKRFYSGAEIQDYSKDFDVIISGSDQILNPSYVLTGERLPTGVYFLDTVSPKLCKVGYAVSFGCQKYPEEAAIFARKWVNNFNQISVREKTGLNLLKDLGYNNKPYLVPDPVILGGANLINKYKTPCTDNDPYICLYVLRREIQLSEKNVLVLDDEHNPISLEQWLSKIANAQLIVTNSYHGMLVAILSHVPFVVDVEKGSGEGMNDRFYTLLEKLNLVSRIASNRDDLDRLIHNYDIDWADVDERIRLYRKEGELFLSMALRRE